MLGVGCKPMCLSISEVVQTCVLQGGPGRELMAEGCMGPMVDPLACFSLCASQSGEALCVFVEVSGGPVVSTVLWPVHSSALWLILRPVFYTYLDPSTRYSG